MSHKILNTLLLRSQQSERKKGVSSVMHNGTMMMIQNQWPDVTYHRFIRYLSEIRLTLRLHDLFIIDRWNETPRVNVRLLNMTDYYHRLFTKGRYKNVQLCPFVYKIINVSLSVLERLSTSNYRHIFKHIKQHQLAIRNRIKFPKFLICINA